MDRLREEGHGERSGNCEGDRGLELTSATRRCGGSARPIIEGRYSKLGGIKPHKCVITHDVLEVFELWGLLVPVLPPAVVGAGVVPGIEAAGEVAAVVATTDWLASVVAGAEAAEDAPEDAPPAAQSAGLPALTVTGA